MISDSSVAKFTGSFISPSVVYRNMTSLTSNVPFALNLEKKYRFSDYEQQSDGCSLKPHKGKFQRQLRNLCHVW